MRSCDNQLRSVLWRLFCQLKFETRFSIAKFLFAIVKAIPGSQKLASKINKNLRGKHSIIKLINRH